MKIIDVIETDLVNYKNPCMTVMFPYCDYKCNKDAGKIVCQNYQLKDCDLINISSDEIVSRYTANPMSEALVMQGLEPLLSFDDIIKLVEKFTQATSDDIVIYTGYNKDEVKDKIAELCSIISTNKLIIKFGRYIPDRQARFDEVLGVTLASDNQYAQIVNEN